MSNANSSVPPQALNSALRDIAGHSEGVSLSPVVLAAAADIQALHQMKLVSVEQGTVRLTAAGQHRLAALEE